MIVVFGNLTFWYMKICKDFFYKVYIINDDSQTVRAYANSQNDKIHKMRKTIFLLQLLAILFFKTVFGQYDATTDSYTLQDSDVTVENGKITHCATSATDWGTGKLIIPDTLDNQRVVQIQGDRYNEGFMFRHKGLTEVFLPSSLKVIERCAFANNQIEQLHFADNSQLSVIMRSAFSYNNLSDIIIPRKVVHIGEGAFGHNNLTSVEFEPFSFIRYIQRAVFSNNSSLMSYTLPTNVNPGFKGYTSFDNHRTKKAIGTEVSNINATIVAELPIHVLTPEDIDFENGTLNNYYAGYMKVHVPEYMEGKRVRTISRTGFSLRMDSVILSHSIDTIRQYAFVENNFTNYTIPSNIKYLDEGVGIYLNSPGDIEFEENSSLEYIGRGVFQVPEGKINALPNDVIKEGYIFSHWEYGSTQVDSIVENNQPYQAKFTQATAYTVSGNIDIDMLEGVSLILSGDFSGYRYPENDKSYSFLLNAGRTITITPQKEGYSFTPESRTISNLQTETSNLNFTASQTGAVISGSIAIDNIENIWLQISGDFIGTVKLQEDGTYTLPVNAGRNITLTPIKDGYTFSPQSITIENAQGNMSENNFETVQSFFMVSGNVAIDLPEGTVLTIYEDINLEKTLQSNGNFAFTAHNGANITLVPEKEGYVFTPESISISTIEADTSNIQFNATRLSFAVSGTISGTNLNSITLQISGDTTALIQMETDGNYNFSILSGKSITITPLKGGYVFSPEYITLNNVQGSANENNFVVSSATVIKSVKNSSVVVYPNPTSGEFVIESNEIIKQVVLFDKNGNRISTQNFNYKNAVLDIEHLANGLYLLLIDVGGQKISKEIMKK